MPYLNGFNASIIVNDTEVPHYAVDVDEESRTMTCWIPSVPGEVTVSSEFCIYPGSPLLSGRGFP